jgi:hypothetical protein
MGKQLLGGIVALVLALLTSAGIQAHHSFSAEYDRNKPVKVTGTVTRVDWANPHIWFFVDGKDDVTGKAAVWGFSGAPPGMLLRRGIKKEAIKVGDTVKVEGFLARDGSANASGGRVTFADGRQVFTAAAEDAAPK